ncbi:hypothetical protein LX64_02954 [Chitinophaga skermanii]|uniref:Uncharacterized protein n=1 Tax=Chitinophaga skermanii TaxID=331697 RepID=A0A327QQL0_9BACT|nr:hypothetical protein LX64_02954 [Chitinophaga skermanii]
MEILSIAFSIPLLLLICWGLGGLLSVIIVDLDQNTIGQIIAGLLILILVGFLSSR